MIEVRQVLAAGLNAPHIVLDNGEIVAYTPTRSCAYRIAELINRHGLIDVPDTCQDLETP